MEEIRPLRPEDLDKSLQLSQFAFQYRLSEKEYQERISKMKPEQQWGYFVDGELAAKMAILPFHTWIQGAKQAMGGIASVSTWPEYRRQGAVKQLLSHALLTMKNSGQLVSFLHPFSVPFYRKFGWEMYTDYKLYEVKSTQLPHHFIIEGTVSRGWNVGVMKQIYEAYAAQYNGMMARTDEWWSTKVVDEQYHAVIFSNCEQQPEGYLLYRVTDFVMEIKEMVFLNEKARQSLWKFISNHDSMIHKVKLKAPADDDLPYWLPDPRVEQTTIPYFMARIVDAPAFLKEYAYAPLQKETEFAIQLTDSWAPWNNSQFTIAISGDGRAVVEESDKPHPHPHLLTCDIGALTTMMLGYKRPTALFKAGQLQASEESTVKLWESLLTERTTYLSDYF
ncbi:GNAT family N-acetyltransferase [Paenibacillus senegalensis]|uniref:GNAT family N-acetyltransferase n=1 Tax=Paenibacillus senegalensis TaxID=1465766 RepID=UPI000288BE1D|nr:GNAT family N-acetyltransferase [Paenibacillus senegalensis]